MAKVITKIRAVVDGRDTGCGRTLLIDLLAEIGGIQMFGLSRSEDVRVLRVVGRGVGAGDETGFQDRFAGYMLVDGV